MIAIPVQCRLCSKIVQIEVPERGYLAWLDGNLIQKAMPEVSVNDREMLISQTCSSCFDSLFKEK